MTRFWTVCLALILAPLASADGKELKPKPGDIGGVFYTEVSGEPEPASGVVPADRLMQARARTNVRSGPGTDHAKIGLLEAGREVRVTGEAGEWLRIEAPDGGAAFVHGSLLAAPAPQGRDPAAALSSKCAGMSKGGACWAGTRRPAGLPFLVRLLQPHGKLGLVGRVPGQRRKRTGNAGGDVERRVRRARWNAGWTAGCRAGGSSATLTGGVDEGTYLNGKKHGRWIDRYANGRVDEGPYANGQETRPVG